VPLADYVGVTLALVQGELISNKGVGGCRGAVGGCRRNSAVVQGELISNEGVGGRRRAAYR
jgi:hypothetical protein